jgi:hypothetical protein
MKFSAKGLTAVALVVAAAMLPACGSALKSLKSGSDTGSVPAATKAGDKTGSAESVDGNPPLPIPDYKPPPPPDDDKVTSGAIDLRTREEVNEAALEFAKNFPSVVHIKTCYSRLYGGWYLFLYVKKGKKVTFRQYSWDDGAKEWAVSFHPVKTLDPAGVEAHLKGEVDDERCFILK